MNAAFLRFGVYCRQILPWDYFSLARDPGSCVPRRPACHRAVACLGAVLPLLGHLAALHQYRTTVVTLLSEAGRPRHSSDLDEIIKSIDQARNEMIDIEHLSDDELQKFADKYQKVRVEWDNRSRRRKQKD